MQSLLRRTANGESNQPKGKKYVAVKKLKRVGDLKSVSTSDIETQSLDIAQLAFNLSLIQYLLTNLLFLCFWDSHVYSVTFYVGNM